MKRHRNPKFSDYKKARAAAIAISKREGRLYVAKTTTPGNYHVVPVSIPNRKKKRLMNKKHFWESSLEKSPEKRKRMAKALRAGRKWSKLFGNKKTPAYWAALKKATKKNAKKKIFPNRKKGPYKSYREKKLGMDAFARAQRRAFYGYMRGGAPRRRNPDESFIGQAPTLTLRGGSILQFPRGTLRAGSDANSVRLDTGGAQAPLSGSRITRIEYDDPVKAVEAYKEIGRFRHDCADPFVVGPANGSNVILTSKSIAWRRE